MLVVVLWNGILQSPNFYTPKVVEILAPGRFVLIALYNSEFWLLILQGQPSRQNCEYASLLASYSSFTNVVFDPFLQSVPKIA